MSENLEEYRMKFLVENYKTLREEIVVSISTQSKLIMGEGIAVAAGIILGFLGFGNLSMFCAHGREYGFSAFDNNILIAKTVEYFTSGAVSSGKIITVNLNLNLFYWANKILEHQDWENISDIINVAVKYFKDNYKSAIKDIKRIQEEKREKKKKFELSKEEREEGKILDMVPVRKREDLKDIMSALEELTGEKYEISID